MSSHMEQAPGIVPDVTSGPGRDWYAVRCVVASRWPPEAAETVYEERITLWQARTADEAIERAEAEARAYAAAIEGTPATYLGLAQSFHLVDSPADGAEVFSLMRVSELRPSSYLNRHFATGTERQHEAPQWPDPVARTDRPGIDVSAHGSTAWQGPSRGHDRRE